MFYRERYTVITTENIIDFFYKDAAVLKGKWQKKLTARKDKFLLKWANCVPTSDLFTEWSV